MTENTSSKPIDYTQQRVGHTSVQNNGFTTNSTGTVTMNDIYCPKTLVDVKVTEETIELIYVQRAKFTYTTFNPSTGVQQYNSDKTFKEVYGCKDGKLTLLKTIDGRVVPPHTLEESFEFDD